MNDAVIKLVASQMGIPGFVVDELKASRPTLVKAHFSQNGTVTLTVNVSNPNGDYPVIVTLPEDQLQRFPGIHEQAVRLAN